jgi:hypothetical protein
MIHGSFCIKQLFTELQGKTNIMSDTAIHCMYYRADLNGNCAGAIVNYFYSLNNIRPVLTGVDKGDLLSDGLLAKLKGSILYLVDFAYDPETMQKLRTITDRLIWIHHNKIDIDYSIKHNYNDITGIRDSALASCELTWEYLFQQKDSQFQSEIPLGVTLLGRYSVWDHTYSKMVVPFYQGLKVYYHKPHHLRLWKSLFIDPKHANTNKIVVEGEAIIRARQIESKIISNSTSYLTNFKNLTFLTLNRQAANAQFFSAYEGDTSKFQAFLVYYYNGKFKKWKVSMYQNPANKTSVDLLSIAQSYNGGGNINACGFLTDTLPSELIVPM